MAQSQTSTKTRSEITYPNRYNAVMLNDDHTPMDFVITLIVDIFNKNIETAQNLTMQIHEKGRAIVGTYSKEVAEQKVIEATSAARYAGFPLKIVVEPV